MSDLTNHFEISNSTPGVRSLSPPISSIYHLLPLKNFLSHNLVPSACLGLCLAVLSCPLHRMLLLMLPPPPNH